MALKGTHSGGAPMSIERKRRSRKSRAEAKQREMEARRVRGQKQIEKGISKGQEQRDGVVFEVTLLPSVRGKR